MAVDNMLSEIPFRGQIILAQQDGDGEVLVALKPVCENMGIAFNAQYERLQRQEWAVVRMMRTTGADGKTYNMVAVDRQTFTMWLATIDTARIKNPQAKALIVSYQKEAAQALDAYFNEGGALRVGEQDTDMDIMARALLIAQHTIERKNQRLAQATATITVLEPKARTLDVLTSVEGTYSVADAAKLLSNDTGLTVGRDRLFTFMAQLGWIYRDAGTHYWKAYQKQVENGRLEMKTHVKHGTDQQGRTFPFPPTIRVTGKGLADLHRRLVDRGNQWPAAKDACVRLSASQS
ncbi:hypothetical protein BAAM0499_03705 [Bifidobacterium animalis subsp. animalis MCC 0499]|uniref:phage antirepressor N-terminal domain-containing protein n=1 Tax=Bifidobacterium animalis TaxID=28025 RepID=UPI00069A5C7E|nr:phage antirepressor N-terminal domain-containing protein [Bifidobacterium animalis]KOA60984.1 hypothetical protein BAAM0499_03705 [Bifidobacterium animalis subsp. animalis MCC 0499]